MIRKPWVTKYKHSMEADDPSNLSHQITATFEHAEKIPKPKYMAL